MADSNDPPAQVTEVLDGGQVPVLPSSSNDEHSIRSTYDVQASNLEKYEAMFATRFTKDSESFASIAENGFAKTVAVYPWNARPKRNFDYGRRNGGGGGNYRGRGGGGGGGYRREWRRNDRDRGGDRGSRDQRNDRNDRFQRDDYRDRRSRDWDDRERVQYPGRR